MPIIRLDDLADQPVAHDVEVREVRELDARHVPQHVDGLDQPRASVPGEVDLGDVARHDGL